MAKNIEGLYNSIFKLRSNMESIIEDAGNIATQSREFQGEIARVLVEQINKYFIPSIRSFIDNEKQPGSIVGIVRFLDSVPLAMTREAPTPEPVQPIYPENPAIVTPQGTSAASDIDKLPTNVSYAKPEGEVVQEKILKESNSYINDLTKEFYNLIAKWTFDEGITLDEKTFNSICEIFKKKFFIENPNEEEIRDYQKAIEEKKETKKSRMKEAITKYQVVRILDMPGSLSAELKRPKANVVAEFDFKEDAEERAAMLNKTVTAGEKESFGTRYEVVERKFGEEK